METSNWLTVTSGSGYDSTTEALYVLDFSVPVYMQPAYVLVGVLGMLSNMFVFGVLYKHRSEYPSITESLLLHQALVDMLSSAWAIVTALCPPPQYYPNYPSCWDDFLCRVWATQVRSHSWSNVFKHNLLYCTVSPVTEMCVHCYW